MFDLSMRCFFARNFGDNALSNRIMATRFDVEVCRHFHAERFRASWLDRGKELSRRLATDSADGMTKILEHVRRRPPSEDVRLVDELVPGLRETERVIADGARELARELSRTIGCGHPLTDIGDRVATPLQTARLAAGGLA